MTIPASSPRISLTTGHVVRTWWPLAISWLLMTSEQPLMSAVIARLPDSKINLAAWGVVFSLSVIIQAPSAMLLAASTALSKDWASYIRLRRFMVGLGLSLTALHLLLAFTPLYYVVMINLINAPPEILQPARVGLMVMVPWSWGTGYRRFGQGVLIRFGRSRTVVWGSLLRLGLDGLFLAIGYGWGGLSGVVVATAAIIAGVLGEAIYTGVRIRPILQQELKPAAPVEPLLTWMALLKFYIPLALTVFLTFLIQPLVSASLSRMPNALDSLAVWPVLIGFVNMWQSAGLGYNETVIALLEESQAVRALRRFTWLLFGAITALLLVTAATPLAGIWFEQVAGVTPVLVTLARQGLWLALLLPGLRILQSWYQGNIVYSRHTRGVTESVLIFLLTSGAILWFGIAWGAVTGLYVGLAAFTAGFLTQTLWLWLRSRPAIQAVQRRDGADSAFTKETTYVPT